MRPGAVRGAPALVLGVGLLLAGAAGRVEAAPTLSIVPASPLTGLHVGDTVTVNLVLTGLVAPIKVVALQDRVLFDPALAHTTAATAGTIVPGGAAFTAINDNVHGVNDTEFDDLGSSSVATNGVFASFLLTAVGLGSGSLSFDPGSSGFTTFEGIDVGFNGPIPITVLPNGGGPVVPEPSTLGGAAVGALAAVGYGWGRRRRR